MSPVWLKEGEVSELRAGFLPGSAAVHVPASFPNFIAKKVFFPLKIIFNLPFCVFLPVPSFFLPKHEETKNARDGNACSAASACAGTWAVTAAAHSGQRQKP